MEKTINDAKRNVNKRLFAKHLMNSRKEPKNILDSKKEQAKNKKLVEADFYLKRDETIFKETAFSIKAERDYQQKQHHKFETNKLKDLDE